MAVRGEERIFVRPRKIFRARYSTREAAAGGLAALGLAAVAAWISWKGAHPAPDVLGGPATPVRRAAEAVDRGPFPEGLAPAGWREQRLAVFDASNLYVKIDGREGYYRSFGFQKLHCLTLSAASGDPAIDLELYDLGAPLNALGAAAGELPEGSAAEYRAGSLWSIARNTLYLARGKYYLRAIASAESSELRAALAALRDRFGASLPAQPLPWSYALFAGLGVSPAKVSFQAENAFSFGFARDVHLGLLEGGDTELFAAAASDAAAARALAARFAKGFAEYGQPLGKEGGAAWFKDKYLGRASAAAAAGRLVLGVHGAADARAGAALLGRLQAAAAALPAGTDFSAPPPAERGGEP